MPLQLLLPLRVPHLRVPCFVQPRDFFAFAITNRAPLLPTGWGRTQLLKEPVHTPQQHHKNSVKRHL
jgi:hypothetical protein